MASVTLEFDTQFRQATTRLTEAARDHELNYLRRQLAHAQEALNDSREQLRETTERWILTLEESASDYRQMAENYVAMAEFVHMTNVEFAPEIEEGLRSSLELVQSAILRCPDRPRTFSGRDISNRFERAVRSEREAQLKLLQSIILVWPPALDFFTEEFQSQVLTFRIPWWAYLRSMWNLFWSAIRHPFSETTIDLSTGRVLYRT